jgi:hypothetical protein
VVNGSFTGGVIVLGFEVGDPAIIDYFDLPQLILGVPLPLEDNFPVEGDFAAGAVKVHFASHVT